MPDTIHNTPLSVTVAFPRADYRSANNCIRMNSGVRVESYYTQNVVGTGHVGTQVIHSTAIANFEGDVNPVNAVELQALAARIGADWYAWRLGSLEIRLESVVPWIADGFHDVEYLHGYPGITTAIHRSSWEPEHGELKHAGEFGSADESPVCGPQGVEVADSVPRDGKFDGVLLLRDNGDESDEEDEPVWLYDWAEAESLTLGDRYNGTFRGIEVGGPFLISIDDDNTGHPLTDTDKWIDLVTDPGDEDAWSAGTFPAGTLKTHDSSTWVSIVETTEEPGTGEDWVEVTLVNAGGYSALANYLAGAYVQEVRAVYAIRSSKAATINGQTGPDFTLQSADGSMEVIQGVNTWYASTETTSEPGTSPEWHLVHRWVPRDYAEGDVVTHRGEAWLANGPATDLDEPGEESVWEHGLSDNMPWVRGDTYGTAGITPQFVTHRFSGAINLVGRTWYAPEETSDEPGTSADWILVPAWSEDDDYDDGDVVMHADQPWTAFDASDHVEPHEPGNEPSHDVRWGPNQAVPWIPGTYSKTSFVTTGGADPIDLCVKKATTTFALTGRVSALLSADVDDFDPHGLEWVTGLDLTAFAGADFVLNGLARSSVGRLLIVKNAGTTGTIIIPHESGTSEAVNRFFLPLPAQSLTLTPNQCALLQGKADGGWDVLNAFSEASAEEWNGADISRAGLVSNGDQIVKGKKGNDDSHFATEYFTPNGVFGTDYEASGGLDQDDPWQGIGVPAGFTNGPGVAFFPLSDFDSHHTSAVALIGSNAVEDDLLPGFSGTPGYPVVGISFGVGLAQGGLPPFMYRLGTYAGCAGQSISPRFFYQSGFDGSSNATFLQGFTGTANGVTWIGGHHCGGTFTSIADGDKGDITVSSSGSVWAIDDNAVDDSALRDSDACSVIGRAANSGGDPGDISASSNDTILRRVSDSLDFGQLTVDMAPDGLWTVPKGGTGATSLTSGKILHGNGTSAIGVADDTRIVSEKLEQKIGSDRWIVPSLGSF